mgnify:CR=1 FL=1
MQSLYEKKLATYPRTDSQYLTKDMQPTAASLILWLRDNMPFGKGCAGEPDIDRVTDDSKVTDHHAIIPTGVQPQGLSDMEKRVFDLIARRFIAVFYPDCKFSTTTVIGEADQIEFKVTGKQILEPGWRVIFAKDVPEEGKENEEESVLPASPKEKAARIARCSTRNGHSRLVPTPKPPCCVPWKLPESWWTTMNCGMP